MTNSPRKGFYLAIEIIENDQSGYDLERTKSAALLTYTATLYEALLFVQGREKINGLVIISKYTSDSFNQFFYSAVSTSKPRQCKRGDYYWSQRDHDHVQRYLSRDGTWHTRPGTVEEKLVLPDEDETVLVFLQDKYSIMPTPVAICTNSFIAGELDRYSIDLHESVIEPHTHRNPRLVYQLSNCSSKQLQETPKAADSMISRYYGTPQDIYETVTRLVKLDQCYIKVKGDLTNLEHLYLNNNSLTTLRETIGDLTNL
jgi:hypothetical protein